MQLVSTTKEEAEQIMPQNDVSPRILFLSNGNLEEQPLLEVLQLAGYQVEQGSAKRLQNALNNGRPYDLLLIDKTTTNLPLLLKRSGLLAISLILIEQGQEEEAIQALQWGVGDYIIKDKRGSYLKLLPLVLERVLTNQRLSIQREAFYNAIQERNDVLTLLNEISNELSSTLDINEVLERLMAATIRVMGAQGCSIWLWENDDQEYLVCRAVTDQVVSPPLLGVRVDKNQGVVGWVAQKNQSAVVQQTADDVRFLADVDVSINFQTQSLMAMPMRIREEVIGVLEIVNKLEGEFNEDDLAVAGALASSAATAIENARLVEKLWQHTTDLEERNAELDAFAHTVAHDIQNMLARIVGFAELLKMDLSASAETVSREEMWRSAAYISNNSRKMSRVVEALLLLAAVRQTEIELQALDMDKIIQEVLERVSDIIREKEATIHLPQQWPLAFGYAPWIEEVWYNYINNALKYGGTKPHITIKSELSDNGRTATFWVKDQGPGIAPEHQEHLFAPFTQIGERRKRQKGHGLGLSIVERIVKKMGGTVGVNSTVGKGSHFFFTLPTSFTKETS